MTATSTAPRSMDYSLETRDGAPFQFTGMLLGHGSSDDGVRPRWFEIELYRRTDGMYVVYTLGKTRLEGEKTFYRLILTPSAFEIIELLTVFHSGKTYLPRQSSRALAQAAQWDDNVRDAYVNRAIE